MAIKNLKPGSPAKLSKLSNEEHKTAPPGRFSETKLVAELEARDIGRPSTFSSIVSLIQERGYVAKKGTQLYPTPLGFAVARLLAAKFPSFTAYEYTAEMENELDDIASGKKNRVSFLKGFWNGKDGFENLLNEISKDIDFKEIEKYARVDLHNGYSIRTTRFGTFLQNDEGKPDSNGYLPSVRLDDSVDVWDYKEVEACRKVFEEASNKVEARELGILEAGEYAGWTVWARDGKFGPYLQALHPKHVEANEKQKKPAASVPAPINHQIPEGLAIETVELKDVAELFSEVKLPRWSPDKKWLVGIGKRGAYIGKKATVKSRPVFRSLPETEDPRTITFEKVQELWAEAENAAAEKKAAKAAPKKAPAKRPAARKPAAKKPAPKK